eukprot:CAMPEP_0177670580 /NCGR_PEP_ID=MMETSP0447-20121125/24169_1 /TAXON_ID=0 /ORGANISM="Stygamoeba regulata, Strain BSH-02190019" /LENGTH=81 /DNA_ID=CAMNT_0019177761 /DNA_START=70 /DNA_END=312 /DNA_ORIENTATION=+
MHLHRTAPHMHADDMHTLDLISSRRLKKQPGDAEPDEAGKKRSTSAQPVPADFSNVVGALKTFSRQRFFFYGRAPCHTVSC